MRLTRHQIGGAFRWALDGRALPDAFSLGDLLAIPASEVRSKLVAGEPVTDPVVAPIEPDQEVWASGVTYLRSRQER
ncbi:MAG TPA: hypothetical protein VFT74_07795, partial [Isosphaeraceae bacterium]|nr:hypothetical protein [Isosphaeraceae bacterium]